MRLQMLFAILFLPLACWDETPVQPESRATAEIAPVRAQALTGDADKMVPFKADGVWWGTPGDATEAEVADCAAVDGVVDVGAGIITVTHLGRSGYRFLNCWGEAGLIYQEGKITAANGDELYYSGPGQADWEVFEVDWEAGSYVIGLVRFDGGTGRFAGATGSFLTFGDAFYGDQGWYGTELWEGEISSVGSSR
jgi:hypothetical protein